MRIALGLEYDGASFHGWQSQADGSGVQDAVEKALAQIANAPVAAIGAGRTDSGVHATMQIAHFDTDALRPDGAWVRGVNALLPEAIAVLWAMPVSVEFHARFSATGRHYTYLLVDCPVRPALRSGKVGWYHLPLSVEAMREAADALYGKLDFSAFRAAECQAQSPVRLLDKLEISREGNMVRFDFHADGFLHHMIRNIVGSLVYVGNGRKPPSWIAELVAGRDRTRAAPTFSSAGLYLTGIDYPVRWNLPTTLAPLPPLHFTPGQHANAR
jgi:tRNA pseudouridine38-40 synthase